MKSKLEQNNQAYKKAIGEILLKLMPGELPLSVSDVLLDPSLEHGRVWLLTTPTTLAKVVERRHDVQSQLRTKIKGRYTPRLEFLMDDQYLGKLDNLFEAVEKDIHEN